MDLLIKSLILILKQGGLAVGIWLITQWTQQNQD